MKMSVSVDVEESDLEHAPKDLQEIALHLGWQSARTSQALAAKTMNGPLKYRNEVLEYVEDILNVLSDLSPVSNISAVPELRSGLIIEPDLLRM